MMNKDEKNGVHPTDLGLTLTDTLARSDLSSAALELGEIPLDAFTDSGVLRDIPVLGTLSALWRAGVTVRDHLFTKKLIRFLSSLKEVPSDRRSEMVARLEADPHFGRRVGEEVVLLLDRLDSTAKADLVGRAFRAYCEGLVDALTLQRINSAIDRILMADLRRLPQLLDNAQSIDRVTKYAFLNAGLAHVEGLASGTVVVVDRDLCQAIVRHVLTDSDAG